MGLLDKAKKMKEEEGAKAPEPEVKKETVAKPIPRKRGPAVGKKVRKKMPAGPAVKRRPAVKKRVPTAKKVPMKKLVPKLKVPKPKREKRIEEPVMPAIEGLPEDIEFASVTSRLMAQVIDGIILAIVLGILLIALVIPLETAGLGIWFILYLIVPIGYFMMMEAERDGQTIGKGMTHVRVISLDGRALTPNKVMKSAIAKGLFYPILNILDAVFGVWIQHKDTMQRYSQYETDLIVIAVEKKKRVYGQIEPEEEEEAEAEEESKEAEEEPEEAKKEEEAKEEEAPEETK